MALHDRPVGMVGQRHSYAASASEAPASLTPYALQGAFRGARPSTPNADKVHYWQHLL